jgi:chromosome segregation ATPase
MYTVRTTTSTTLRKTPHGVSDVYCPDHYPQVEELSSQKAQLEAEVDQSATSAAEVRSVLLNFEAELDQLRADKAELTVRTEAHARETQLLKESPEGETQLLKESLGRKQEEVEAEVATLRAQLQVDNNNSIHNSNHMTQ